MSDRERLRALSNAARAAVSATGARQEGDKVLILVSRDDTDGGMAGGLASLGYGHTRDEVFPALVEDLLLLIEELAKATGGAVEVTRVDLDGEHPQDPRKDAT